MAMLDRQWVELSLWTWVIDHLASPSQTAQVLEESTILQRSKITPSTDPLVAVV